MREFWGDRERESARDKMSKNCYLAILKRVGDGVSVIELLLFAGNDYMIFTSQNSFHCYKLTHTHTQLSSREKNGENFL